MRVTVDDQEHGVTVEGETVTVDGRTFAVHVEPAQAGAGAGTGRALRVLVDGRPYRVELPEDAGARFTARVDDRERRVELQGIDVRPQHGARPHSPLTPALSQRERGLGGGRGNSDTRHPTPDTRPGAIVAPMAGRIVRLAVAAGDWVERGGLLLVLEAMKMENEIRAPLAGRIARVEVVEGQRVAEGTPLLHLEDADPSPP